MSDVKETKACARMPCLKGGIIEEDDKTKEVNGKLYHEGCAPTQKENESCT